MSEFCYIWTLMFVVFTFVYYSIQCFCQLRCLFWVLFDRLFHCHLSIFFSSSIKYEFYDYILYKWTFLIRYHYFNNIINLLINNNCIIVRPAKSTILLIYHNHTNVQIKLPIILKMTNDSSIVIKLIYKWFLTHYKKA